MMVKLPEGLFGKIILTWLLILTFALSIALGQVNENQILDYLERICHETGAPGISMAIALKGKIIFSGGAGYAELDNFSPATGRIVHNIASISKTHAAVALMQLVEQGKVNLDDPIQKYVPYFPKKKWEITARHILTHTSGIRHYRKDDFGEQRYKEKIHYDSLKTAIEIFKDDTLLFQPGKSWFYSSYASNLMQGIVEEATGVGFEEYLRKNVWQPAGMLSTQFDVPERIVHNRGKGYVRNKKGLLVNIPYADVSYKYAGGGIISCAEDLVRFGMALNHGKLLKAETLAKMYEVQVDPVMKFNPKGEPEKQKHKQALSWYIRTDAQGRDFPSHTGTVKGCRSYLLNYPQYDLVVALIANIVPFDSPKYGNSIAQMFLPAVNEGIN
ncbi:MAG: beta-lactamase family protein [bacterium]|nr:MAG: beta-lactamase family protein [bacterium]